MSPDMWMLTWKHFLPHQRFQKKIDWLYYVAHSHTFVAQICCKFIYTPQFGRLRGIHQLGGSRFVFSGATHSRFAHSLGVCHLAGCVVDHLNILQKMKISEEEKETVMLAGRLLQLRKLIFSRSIGLCEYIFASSSVLWTCLMEIICVIW